jgi:hypothetical protein
VARRSRPLAKSWLRMFARSAASAKRRAMIASSSSATSTSTRATISSSRWTFDAVSVITTTFVSRWAMSPPRAEMSGRSSVLRSATEAYRTGTICVITSSALRALSGASPTMSGIARSFAPSILMIL